MPRRPRLHISGACYHVTLRGNHRANIFFRPADRRILDGYVADAIEHTAVRIHAYCWMTNHVHLLIQVADIPLGAFMQRISSRYARAVQKRIPTTGHLFENRYDALVVDVDRYFLELLRYIHLNPVRAGIVPTPERYRWSSHRVYLGIRESSWVNTEFGLSLFHSTPERARALYERFVAERIGAASDPTLYQGHPEEPRVLGGDAFISKLAIPIKKPKPRMTFDSIVRHVCAEYAVTADELRAPSRARPLAQARHEILCRALDHRAASMSEIARFLNRDVSTLSRNARNHRR